MIAILRGLFREWRSFPIWTKIAIGIFLAAYLIFALIQINPSWAILTDGHGHYTFTDDTGHIYSEDGTTDLNLVEEQMFEKRANRLSCYVFWDRNRWYPFILGLEMPEEERPPAPKPRNNVIKMPAGSRAGRI